MGRNCSDCGRYCSSRSFSQKQWQKGDGSSRCKDCTSRGPQMKAISPPPPTTKMIISTINRNDAYFLGVAFILGVFLALIYDNGDKSTPGSLTSIMKEEPQDIADAIDQSPHAHYKTWDDAPASWEEFGHDNDPNICGVPVLTVEEWEAGRYWEKEKPVLVKNITDGWPALDHWTKEEMLNRYPDVKVGMGVAKDLGFMPWKTTDTTIKDFILHHMHDPKGYYVFDRKVKMPDELLADVQPYPMPTRTFAETGDALNDADGMMWKDHLTFTIGSDQQGAPFHRHHAAWNVVLFGAKRWILYDAERIANHTRLTRMAWDADRKAVSTPDWIRKLYPNEERMYEIRNYGHDCVQRAGEMMFIPNKWQHMVVNIGDTIAIVSESGHNKLA